MKSEKRYIQWRSHYPYDKCVSSSFVYRDISEAQFEIECLLKNYSNIFVSYNFPYIESFYDNWLHYLQKDKITIKVRYENNIGAIIYKYCGLGILDVVTFCGGHFRSKDRETDLHNNMQARTGFTRTETGLYIDQSEVFKSKKDVLDDLIEFNKNNNTR